MKWLNVFLILLIAFSISFCYTVNSAQNPAQFAQNLSAAKCQDQNVKSVYICNGYAVKVVSTIDSQGSTFYLPDGRVAVCPPEPPSQTSGLCFMYLAPSICPTQAECGSSSAPSPMIAPVSSPVNPTNSSPLNVSVPVVSEPLGNSSEQASSNQSAQNQSQINNIDITGGSRPVSSGTDQPLANLAWIVGGLGLIAIIVLFVLFKKTLSE